MNLYNLNRYKNGINLIWVISAVTLISFVLVLVSFIFFINSGAYDTVRQISAATDILEKDDLEGYDITSPIQANDIDVYSETLNARVKNFNSDEFSNEIISEEKLGY